MYVSVCTYIHTMSLNQLTMYIFRCSTAFIADNFLDYLKQDIFVFHKIFLGNISLSTVFLLSIVSWFTRSTIFSISSWNSKFSWSARCSYTIIPRFPFMTRYIILAFQVYVPGFPLSPRSPLTPLWPFYKIFLVKVISRLSSFTKFTWLARFTRFPLLPGGSWFPRSPASPLFLLAQVCQSIP